MEDVPKINRRENGTFLPGTVPNPQGRPLGSPNKASTTFKEAVTHLLDTTAPEYLQWVYRISEEDPARAIEVLVKLAEFAFPKLLRTENKTTIDQVASVKLSTDEEALKAYVGMVKGQITPDAVE